MQQYAVFHHDLHCLQKYSFRGSLIQIDKRNVSVKSIDDRGKAYGNYGKLLFKKKRYPWEHLIRILNNIAKLLLAVAGINLIFEK